MIIYADVLLAVNLYINYFLIRCTGLILRKRVSPVRSVLASLAGAAGSFLIFLPELHPVLNVLFRLLVGTAVTLILFGRQKCIVTLISLLCFLAVSFGFAGGMLALWYFAAPMGMYYANGTAYFNIPIWAAAIFTGILYGAFRLAEYITETRRPAQHTTVKVRAAGTELSLDGLADTGNSLRDSFSGKPVILASAAAVTGIAPESAINYHNGRLDNLEGIRLVPCRTVTGEGLVPVFPAEICINDSDVEALIGISKQNISGADCIFDPSIVSK